MIDMLKRTNTGRFAFKSCHNTNYLCGQTALLWTYVLLFASATTAPTEGRFIMPKNNRWTAEAHREGQRFGRLTVIEYVGIQKRRPFYRLWRCKCDCGNVKVINSRNLVSGNTLSCGCLFKEVARTKPVPNKLAKGQAAANALFYNYQKSARERHIEWKLSKDQFLKLVFKECYYCGTPPSSIWWGNSKKSCNGAITYNGIDRVNNDKGYFIENSVTCCKHCNVAKASMTQEEFFGWIRKVYFRSVWSRPD